jgi:hypothetical protein
LSDELKIAGLLRFIGDMPISDMAGIPQRHISEMESGKPTIGSKGQEAGTCFESWAEGLPVW